MSSELIDIETLPVSKRIVDNMGVTEDDEVAVITDAKRLSIGRSIASACNSTGATTSIVVMPLIESHSNEPTRIVAEAMLTADVAFTCTTKAISHTDTRQRVSEQGTRLALLRGVTEDMMIEGAMTVDFHKLREVTDALGERLTAAKSVHVTSDRGTDIELSIEGCQGFSLSGFPTPNNARKAAAFPPGEAPVRPKEGTANGTIVIDVSMDDIGKLSEPIRLEVEDGYVTDVSGGDEADELRGILEKNDDNARNLAEFAIGTNPKAKLIGNLAEDKKKEGTVHFAVGDNQTLGGNIRSDIHLDGVIRRPTVRVDDTLVVENGVLLKEDSMAR